MLLSSELHGKIHEPNFYFDTKEENRLAALDLLMLTHGWRRFHWRQILNSQAEDWHAMVKYPVEKVAVEAYAQLNGRSLRNARLKVKDEETLVLATDNYGRFFMENPPANFAQEPIAVKYQGIQAELLVDQVTARPPGVRFQPGVVPADQPSRIVKTTDEIFEEETEEVLVVSAEEPVIGSGKHDIARWDDLDKDEEGTMQLDEVVVIGYGVEHKKMLTSGSIHVMDSDDLRQGGNRFDLDIAMDMNDVGPQLKIINARSSNYITFGRVFAFPDYSQQHFREEEKVDKRKTIFWSPDIITDRNGKASVSFYTTDEMTTFRAILEGIGNNNLLAHTEFTFAAASPLAVQLKMPAFALTGDVLEVPVVVTNNTNRKINTPLTAKLLGDDLEWIEQLPTQLSIAANSFEQFYAKVKVTGQQGESGIQLSTGSQRWVVQQEEMLQVHQVGFPHEASTSGQQQRASYEINIKDPMANTIRATFRLFPDVTGQLLSGLEGMLGQPGGCFEQTSSTNYPNIMVLQYLQEHQQLDAATRERSFAYLQSGYDRLASYEVTGGGFSLWGQSPAEPVLSAFGLMQ
ncbi:MAG: alpha-2-macroglobulin family protein, partial [Bacteroidota bacterium]